MSRLQSLASAGITSLGTTFAAAVTTASAGAAAFTAQKMAEMGDYNAAAIPATAAFMAVAWGAMTFMGAKASKQEWGSVFKGAPKANTQEISPGPDA